jgi:uncharacterized repeat protein (TIGR02543 family)
MSGGFALAMRDGGLDVVLHAAGDKLTLTGGVACRWMRPGGAPTYIEGDSTDLKVSPAGATAKWGNVGGKAGIVYENGSTSGFYPIDDVTVNTTATIHTVKFNSNDGSEVDSQFVISGNKVIKPTPDPKKEGHAFAEWYTTAALTTAYNFDDAVTADFTLYAKWTAGVAPAITGPTSMTLAEGYAATPTPAFTVTGTAPITPIKESGNAAITLDIANSRLNIAAGLTAGTYPVVLKAANAIGSATHTFTLTVTAAGSSGMPNFIKSKTYKPGQFTDVNEDLWYGFNQQKVIARAYEYGLMEGNSATAFNPAGNITLAEAVTVAARVHSIYNAGVAFTSASSPWYQGYVDYAINKGILTAAEAGAINWNKAATRAEMAYIFSRALPEAEFASQNTVNSLPDANSSTPYYSAILVLYKAGVLAGSDAKGTFNPGNNITRAEAAAIISRVILPDTRFGGKIYGL